MATTLSTYLKTAEATHAREELLMHRLLYDVKLAAARREYHLITYRSDVDHDGFDVILDDRQMLRKFQVKSVLGNTAAWDIHKWLLRPEIYSADQFGFESSPTGIGQEGGVILMTGIEKPDGDLAISYGYTDLHILVAIELQLINRAPNSRKAVDRVMRDLRHDIEVSDRVEIPFGGFVIVRSVDALLALAGIHSVSTGQWRFNLMQISAAQLGTGPVQDAGYVDALRTSVAEELEGLVTTSPTTLSP